MKGHVDQARSVYTRTSEVQKIFCFPIRITVLACRKGVCFCRRQPPRGSNFPQVRPPPNFYNSMDTIRIDRALVLPGLVDSKLFQRSAEPLDAFTGIFQGFSIRRVGNAKVWPQPESGSVDHSNPFLFQQSGHEVLI